MVTHMVASAINRASVKFADAGNKFLAIRFSFPTGKTPMGSLTFST
jgi:hypothetical protein